MTKRIMTIAALAALVGIAAAAPNVDPDSAFVWGENVGWLNAYAGGHGVVASPHILSGYMWGENVGWLNLGDGTPDTPPHYSNTSADDCGVNHDGAGHLSGYAWGENIGWVVFDTSGAGGSQVAVTPEGVFSGFAWGENIGWINFGPTMGKDDPEWGLRLADSDGDVIPDAFETNSGEFISEYDTGTNPNNDDTDGDDLDDGDEVNQYLTDPNDDDTDDDGYDDLTEILAGTDPNDPEDNPGTTSIRSLHVPSFTER